MPSFHSLAISSVSHIFWINLYILFHNSSPAPCINSEVILPDPAALFNFRFFIFPSISSYAGAGTSISSLFPFSSYSCVSSIIPLLNNSSEHCFCLPSTSFFSARIFPFLFLHNEIFIIGLYSVLLNRYKTS
jgi:hypothetical protein